MVFAVVFKKNKFKGVRFKKRKPRAKGKYLKYSIISLLLPRSSVKINSLVISLPKTKPYHDSVLFGVYNGVISSFLSFLENTSNFFEASNIRVEYSEHNIFKKQVDAELKISLLDALISYLKIFALRIYYRLFYKRIYATK